MRHLLGVDAGGSGTRALLVDGAGRELGRGAAGPGNLAEVGLTGLVACVREAGVQAGVQWPVDGLYLCGAGIWTGEERVEVARALVEAGLGELGRVWAASDLASAQAGAFGGGAGVVLVAGTGSVAFGRDAVGGAARAGGLGPLFDDPGSGFDLGRRALGAAAQAADGRGPGTVLGERLLATLGLTGLRAVARAHLAGELDRARVAGLAPVVLEAAGAGDEVAREVLAAATAGLAQAARAVVERLEQGESLGIACQGGLLHSSVYAAALTAALGRQLPDNPVVRPAAGPLEGAAYLARMAFDAAEPGPG
ncbi:MAG: N-acetylglucosamine kinase-like BadF-type ATPase [Planctomycetota bacterium]|jgi:N-acetylglucosamine kinase-like BadF-type ATPase